MIGNSGPVTQLPGMTLKAWAFLKSDGTLLRSFGVASAVRNAAGQYVVTCSTAFASAAAVGVAYVAPFGGVNITTIVTYNSAAAIGVHVQAGGVDADAHVYVAIYE